MKKSFLEVKYFFDADKIVKAVDRATRKILSRMGAFVRRTARQSIRRPRRLRPGEMTKAQRQRWHRAGNPVWYAPSDPGKPPRNQTGKLKGNIFFWYDPGAKSVVVGAASFGGFPVPGVLEKGGRTKTRGGRTPYIKARPYMGPALEKERPKLMPMWKDSVRA